MVWAYVMENGNGVEKHSNQPVFQLIQKMGLTDEQLVFDQDNNRGEFCKLLESMDVGDKLIIRSVADLADDLMNLINVFQKLTDKQISLCSIEEPCMCFSRKRNSRQVIERLVLKAGWVGHLPRARILSRPLNFIKVTPVPSARSPLLQGSARLPCIGC